MALPPVEDVELVNVNIITEFKFGVVVFFNFRVGGTTALPPRCFLYLRFYRLTAGSTNESPPY